MNQATTLPAPPSAEPPVPFVLSVITHAGDIWKMGGAPPGDETMRITKIVRLPSGVMIFAYPQPGSDLDKQKVGLQFELGEVSLKIITTVARFDVLQELEDVAVEIAARALEEQLGDDGEPEPESEPANGTTVPAAPAAPPAPLS